MLRLELEALAEHNFDLELTGFDESELAEVMARETPQGSLDPDVIPELESETVCRTGDLWILGRHRILCGDGTRCEELGRVLNGDPCHLVFTDPPYNVDYCGKGPGRMKLFNDNLGPAFGAFLRSACDAILAVSQGPIYICMSSSELATLQSAFCEKLLAAPQQLDWHSRRSAAGQQSLQVFRQGTERSHGRSFPTKQIILG